MTLEQLKKEITAELSNLDPYKVILFGSHAYGDPLEESDLDLYVVTKKQYLPQSFQENMEHYRSVSQALRPLKKKYLFDLIVHTLPMHKKFITLQSSFSREISTKGIVLYETDHP